jgi:general secretion pathway protein K
LTGAAGQKGVALITVMVIVAIVVVIAGGLLRDHQLDIRRAENVLHGNQAVYQMLGLETWAREVLVQDRKDNRTDHLGEDWATILYPVEADGGLVSGRILDQQGLFNLNALIDKDGRGDPRAMLAFQRLLDTLGDFESPGAITEALVDWMDRDQDVTGLGGREDRDYAILDPPYRTSGGAMTSPTELLLVEGVTFEDWSRLRLFVTTLPRLGEQTSPVNVNTAPAEVLSAWTGVDLAVAGEIVSERGDDPFDAVGEFKSRLAGSVSGDELEQIDFTGFSVVSTYFLVESEARFGNVGLSMRHLIERDGESTKVLARSMGGDW